MNRISKKTLATEARHRITIQQLSKAADGEGGFVETWSTLKQIWAAVYPMSAKQLFEYRTINVEATHIIKIRGLIDLTETDRILFGARVFEILTIENIQERNFKKFITCRESGTSGDEDQTTTTTVAPTTTTSGP